MRRESGNKLRQRTIIISMAIIAVFGFFLTLAGHNTSNLTTSLSLPTISATSASDETVTSVKHMHVYSGNTLASMFHRNQMHYADLSAILKAPLAKQYLPHMKVGETLSYRLTEDGHVSSIRYSINRIKTLVVTRQGTRYQAKIESQPLTSSLLYKGATVYSSLYAAAKAAGLTKKQFTQLKIIFAGSINLDKHARRGDHFSVLYNEYYLKGQKYNQGDIVAATYTHLGKTYKAIRYTYPHNHTGYYTPDGHGVLPLFLSAPLHYKRISSIFTYHRLDPYLHVWRPHLGVDYAAPVGTPVKALGDGTIKFCGRDNGYGNAVIIRFSKKYKALYGHLEKFAPHLHNGEHVQRGQIIGYVGDTGWSTGPHLHFSMYVYGVPKDPLKLKFPGGKSIPASYLKPYLAYSKNLLEQLNLYEGPQFAER